MLVRLIVLPSVLLVAILSWACGEDSVSAPSPITSPIAPAPAPPPPSAVPDFSALVGVWNLTIRLTEVTGSGCVADTMRSQIGEPKPYTLSITPKNSTVSVTLKTASGDRACTFTPVADSSGFTTYGKGGYYSCEEWYLTFRCSDGTQHAIFSLGEDISGHLSGSEIIGAWDAWWFDGWEDYSGFGMKARFTATK
jgi:hypothetical protein